MKYIILFLLLFPLFSNAQVSDKISFQAVVYDNQNKLVVNRNVGVRMSIISGSVDGTTVYQETHLVTTSGTGLFTLQLGGGTPTIGNYSGINWGAASHFLKREFDINGGTNYQIMGIGEILSVPYAIHAKTASNLDGLYSWNYPQGFLKGEVITLTLGISDSYLVPEGFIFHNLGNTGCLLLIDDKAIALGPSSILSNRKIRKYSSSSECTIRGFLTPQLSVNYMDTILSATINYQVPVNKIVRFTSYYGTCVNGIALGFNEQIFFGGEVLNVCRDTGYPANSEFYYSGYFIK